MTGAAPVSIVIEWENVLLAELGRCREMLTRLAEQTGRVAARLGRGFEIVVMLDPEVVDPAMVEGVLAQHLPEQPGVRSVRIEEAPGLHYYDLKNRGAEVTRGDALVFLDSDVVPADDWLERILDPLGGEVEVVAGNAYLEPDGLVAKAFAAYWFFSRPRTEASLEPTTEFFANNVAFLRSTFERYRFVQDDRTTRGACVDLAERMVADGVGFYREWGAQVSHPAPNGMKHVLVRGIAQGRDSVLADGPRPRRDLASVRRAFGRFVYDVVQVVRRPIAEREPLRIRWIELPAVIAIGLVFRSLVLVGKLATLAAPAVMSRHFRI